MSRHFIIASAVLLIAGTPALAQSAGGEGNPAVKDRAPQQTKTSTEGANSFTERQARERLTKAGYTVSSLTKNEEGVWMGSATKSGKPVKVGLDFKGNITVR